MPNDFNKPDADLKMPFSGHTAGDLEEVLLFIESTILKIEVFDAFLGEYKRTGNLRDALAFACSEWDL